MLSNACHRLTIECWSGHACLKSFKLEVVFFGGIVNCNVVECVISTISTIQMKKKPRQHENPLKNTKKMAYGMKVYEFATFDLFSFPFGTKAAFRGAKRR